MSTAANQFQGLTPDDLAKEWRKRHKRSSRAAFNTRLRIAYMVFTGFLLGLTAFWNGVAGALADIGIAHLPVATQVEDTTKQMMGVAGEQAATASVVGSLLNHLWATLLAAISLLLTFLVVYHVRKHIRENTNIDKDKDRFAPLSDTATKALDAMLVPLCKRMMVARSNIRPIRPKTGVGFAPSVIENSRDKTILLVIPADFLTVMTAQPKAAEAMLAHELGHVAQKDSKLWLYASVFAEQLMRYFLPWYLLILAFEIFIAGSLVALVRPLNAEVFFLVLRLVGVGILPVGFLFGFYGKIRRMRRSSEELADLAAWIYCTPHGEGLQEAFALCASEKAKEQKGARKNRKLTPEESAAAFGFSGDVFSKARYFAIHPSVNARLQKVQHYESVTTGKTRRLYLTSYGSVLEGLLVGGSIVITLAGFTLFPVFAQARGKARMTSCMSNEKQLALGLLMYVQDYDETLPGSPNAQGQNVPNPDSSTSTVAWADVLMPYVKNRAVYVCPDVTASPSSTNISTEGPTPTSYLYNGILAMQPLAAMDEPANTLMLHEDDHISLWGQQAPNLPIGSVLGGNRFNTPASDAIHFNRSNYDNQHQEGANIAFADGHVRWFAKDKIRYEWFGALVALNSGLPETLEKDAKAANAAYERSRKVALSKSAPPARTEPPANSEPPAHTDTTPPVPEQPSGSVSQAGGEDALPDKRITLDLENADLYSGLKLLCDQCGISYSMSASLRESTISVHLRDVPLKQALDSMLSASNEPLAYSYKNGIISVFRNDSPPTP